MKNFSVTLIPGFVKNHRIYFVLFIFIFFLFSETAYPQTNITVTETGKISQVQVDPKTAALIEKDDYGGAIKALLKNIEAGNESPGTKRCLALCYKQLGHKAFDKNKFSEAIELFEKGLSHAENDSDLFMGIGLSYFRLSCYDEAEEAFKETIRLDPNHYGAYKQLGRVYYLTNDLPDAVESWSKALNLNNSDISLKKRLLFLKKQVTVSDKLETELTHLFSVTFDGKANPELRDGVIEILRDVFYDIGQQLNAYPNRQIAVTLLTREEFFDITGSPKWAGGVYEGQIKVPVSGCRLESLKKILYHEYVHAVIYDIMSNRCPWWLNEGLAQYFSTDDRDNNIKLAIAAGLLKKGKVPSLSSLPGNLFKSNSGVIMAYAYGLSAVNFLITKFSIYDLQIILEAMGEGMDFDSAILETTGYTLKEFEKVWIDSY